MVFKISLPDSCFTTEELAEAALSTQSTNTAANSFATPKEILAEKKLG